MKNEKILRLAKGCDSPEVANQLKEAAAWEWKRRQDDMEAKQYEKRMEVALWSVAGLGVFLLSCLVLAAIHVH